jgi:4-amino-4-deoxy-L-arabinose transferase-like glycosyltransferase
MSSVFVHVAVTYLVFLLPWRLTGDRWTAWVAALLYGLHPVHVESVAWISGIADPLLALFFLGSLLAYRKRRQPAGSAALLTASLLLYAMALLQKEVAIVLPAVVCAYVILLRPEDQGWRAKLRSAVVAVLPFLAITALYLLARSLALRGMVRTITPISFRTMILTWPSLLWFYLKLLVYPAGLSPFYDVGYVTRPGPRDFVLPLTGVLAAAALLWLWARRSPARARTIAFACALLVLPLLPALYIRVFNYDDYAHDRYLYLPSVGFVILCALAVRQFRPVKLQAALAGVAVALFLAGTLTQQLNWPATCCSTPAASTSHPGIRPRATTWATPCWSVAATLMPWPSTSKS